MPDSNGFGIGLWFIRPTLINSWVPHNNTICQHDWLKNLRLHIYTYYHPSTKQCRLTNITNAPTKRVLSLREVMKQHDMFP